MLQMTVKTPCWCWCWWWWWSLPLSSCRHRHAVIGVIFIIIIIIVSVVIIIVLVITMVIISIIMMQYCWWIILSAQGVYVTPAKNWNCIYCYWIGLPPFSHLTQYPFSNWTISSYCWRRQSCQMTVDPYFHADLVTNPCLSFSVPSLPSRHWNPPSKSSLYLSQSLSILSYPCQMPYNQF